MFLMLSYGFGILAGRALRDRLPNANTSDVPGIVREMAWYRLWVNPLLRQSHAEAGIDKDARKLLNTSLALLPVDASQVEYLYGRLLDAEPQEVPVIRDALAPHRPELLDRLWAVVQEPGKNKERQRLRAAAALAKYEPDSQGWAKLRQQMADDLVSVPSVYVALWMELFRPLQEKLLVPLAVVYRDAKRRETERSLATDILADYAALEPVVLADLLMDADEKQFGVLFPKFKEQGERGLSLLTGELERKLSPNSTLGAREKLAKRQAHAAVALLKMNQPAQVWPLLRHSPDPTVRSHLIHYFGPLGADAAAIVKQLEEEPEVTIRRALLLSLGQEEFGEQAWTPEAKMLVVQQVQEIYRTAMDAGLHAAAEWLLRHWREEAWLAQTDEVWKKDQEQRAKRLEAIRQRFAGEKDQAKPQWYVNGQGQTMVVIPGPVEFAMGSPITEAGRFKQEQQHRKRIGWTFAIGAKPVTVDQFLRFRKDHDYEKRYAPAGDCPVNHVTWYMAAEYCNWLSGREGLHEKEWCYEPNKNGQFAEGMRLQADYLKRIGYRLPTEAEWEYACRAGTLTGRYYGESEELLAKYAWYPGNSGNQSRPVARLKPNDFGLFDMHGNVWNLCLERYTDYVVDGRNGVSEDTEHSGVIVDKDSRVYRAGSFYSHPVYLRSAERDELSPSDPEFNVGFRLARTFR